MILLLLLLVGDGFVYTDKPQGAIVPASKGAEFVKYERSGKPDAFFTPTVFEVRQLEAKLVTKVNAEAGRGIFSKDLHKRLPSYVRQYVGIIVAKQRRIWVRAVSDPEHIPYWKTKPIHIDDGGDSVLTGEFDLGKRTFLFLIPNGEA